MLAMPPHHQMLCLLSMMRTKDEARNQAELRVYGFP
jgi:hypothetical protein